MMWSVYLHSLAHSLNRFLLRRLVVPNMRLTCKPARAHFLRMRFGALCVLRRYAPESVTKHILQTRRAVGSFFALYFFSLRKKDAKGFVRLKRALCTMDSTSKCNDLALKRKRCDSACILPLPRKGIHR